MPKIIENIRENLLAEAKKQVMEQGYAAMTIRSVANACRVGVGTVYNYFPSKDMLVASFMLEDWFICQKAITTGCNDAGDAKEALHCMYTQLLAYKEKHSYLFEDAGAKEGFQSAASAQRHVLLRSQLAEPLLPWTKKQSKADAEFLATFLAESMLTWTMAGIEFEQIATVLLQLL